MRRPGKLPTGIEARASIDHVPGGSGANQAAWLGSLGVRVSLASRVGAADHAYHGALLRSYGVRPLLSVDPELDTGRIVCLVDEGGERTFLTDRGAGVRAPELSVDLVDEVSLVHVSGYALFAPPARQPILDFLARATRAGVPCTVDPGSASFLTEAGAAAFLEWTRAATACFPNVEEARVLSGETEPEEQLRALTPWYDTVAVKLGAGGAMAASRCGSPVRVPAADVRPVDSTGAGDAFCAGFLAAYVAGVSLGDCLAEAVALGGRAVTRPGGRPDRGGAQRPATHPRSR
ncbi:MAG: carbohydrate kinase family protein [Streptosporangiaceae bacterium]